MFEVTVMHVVGDAVMTVRMRGSRVSFQRIDDSVMTRFPNRDGKVVHGDVISTRDDDRIASANFRRADVVILREVGDDVQP